MVEGARLERVYAGNRIKGSNPFLSAINYKNYKQNFICLRGQACNQSKDCETALTGRYVDWHRCHLVGAP